MATFGQRTADPMAAVPPSKLLDLPRELRDIIIDEVISSPITPTTPTNYVPQSPYDISEQSPGPLSTPTISPLALTCAQLRAETLQRASKASVPAILDIFVHPDGTTQCTWLSCPNTCSQLELQINIRFQPIDVKVALDTQSGVGEPPYIPNDDDPYASLRRLRGRISMVRACMSHRSRQFLSYRIRETVLNIIGDRPPMQPIKSLRIDVFPVIDMSEEISDSELYGRAFNGLPTGLILLHLYCDMFKSGRSGKAMKKHRKYSLRLSLYI
jgi:hypothetical protein